MEDFNEKITELLEAMTFSPDAMQVMVSLAAAMGLTLILWIAYRLANTEATYQPRFAATLVSLALLSTILMDLIQSNLALSLGMLGSLSIVRFRTNIRDPRDIGFIFWSMAVGLAASTGSYVIGLVGSLVLGLFLILTGRRSNTPQDMMLVVRGSNTDLDTVGVVVEGGCTRNSVKAKNVLADSFELVYEVRIAAEESNVLIRRLFELEGIDSVNLLSETKAA